MPTQHPDFAETEMAGSVSLFPLGITGDDRPRAAGVRFPDPDQVERLRRIRAATRRLADRLEANAAQKQQPFRPRQPSPWPPSDGFDSSNKVIAAVERAYWQGVHETHRQYRGEKWYWLTAGFAIGVTMGFALVRLGMASL